MRSEKHDGVRDPTVGTVVVPRTADGSPHGSRRSRRDWVVDSVVFAAAGLVSLLIFALTMLPVEGGVFRRPLEQEVGLDLLIGAVAWFALWWRRRYPVLLGLLTAVAGVVSGFTAGAVAVMLLTVAIHRRWPAAVLVAGANVIASVLFVVWLSDGTRTWVEWVAILAFGTVSFALCLAFGMFLRARRQLLGSLRERAERAEAEQRRSLENARQDERTRIAREMHDVLAHRISLVSMHAGALEYQRDAASHEVAAAAGVIRENARQALVDLREVIGVLRGGEDGTGGEVASGSHPQPTLDALDALLEDTRAAGVTVRAEVDLPEDPLPPTTSRTAYRVLQEGLTNARKHGRGGAVTVWVRGAPDDGLSLDVCNALRPGAGTVASGVVPTGRAMTGAGPLPGSGVGLVGLDERTRIAGGRWEHGVVDGTFRLHVWLPWPAGRQR